MLLPWTRHQQSRAKAWKKRLAWALYQERLLQDADVLHATAPAEADHLRDDGLGAPIAVIPNGVPLPDEWKTAPSAGSTRQALFLSRIHPKKGLLNLVEAWADVRPDGWRLVVAGPDEAGHRAEVEAHARRHGVADALAFPGLVADDAKWALYRASDLFVLPTFSENFGIVVAEAMASGLPVLTTTGAPWAVLEETGSGWWTAPEVGALVAALRDATARSDADRLAMGRRARRVVEERFAWDAVVRDLVAVYRWVLGDGPRPACVRLD
jgi:glycosyltransferase involved in cell wall biosynthesis